MWSLKGERKEGEPTYENNEKVPLGDNMVTIKKLPLKNIAITC